MYILKDIINVLDQMAPPELAESWDNVGLMIGSSSQKISKVLCALDINEQVIDEAIMQQAACIITHHPLLFKPIKTIDFDTSKGSIIKKMIQNNIAAYAMHTNFDCVQGGTNDILCEKLGIHDTNILHISNIENIYKIAVYVPETHFEQVRKTVIDLDMCDIGHYKGCTFSTAGEGTFIPVEESNPFLGKYHQLEKVNEKKIEFVAYQKQIPILLHSIRKVHPYEEMAYDVYLMSNLAKRNGIGRYGSFSEEMTLEKLTKKIKQCFNLEYIRLTDTKDRVIKRAAVCTGSGAEYLKEARDAADVYITGDIKYHEAQEAIALDIPVIDIGHYVSENLSMNVIASRLTNSLEGLKVVCSAVNGETIFIK